MDEREPQLRCANPGLGHLISLIVLQAGALRVADICWSIPLFQCSYLIKPQMIAVSSVIGVTIFYGDGEALEVAGPSGALLAFAVVGVVAICVMEGISEMIQMFPTPNALMEFVRAFVDPDLAWVVGVAYW